MSDTLKFPDFLAGIQVPALSKAISTAIFDAMRQGNLVTYLVTHKVAGVVHHHAHLNRISEVHDEIQTLAQDMGEPMLSALAASLADALHTAIHGSVPSTYTPREPILQLITSRGQMLELSYDYRKDFTKTVMGVPVHIDIAAALAYLHESKGE